jgi:aryl-alcohol dehydrogenase-like predicted oxidoreductase
MHYRSFGRDTFKVSEIGLGAWQLGGDWGDVDDATAEATLDAAVASGVNFIDTADVYGAGKSEQRIGKFLRKHAGKNLFVATKLGRRGDPGWPENFERATVRQHTEDSLRRLGVDALDLTQLHCIPTDVLRAGAIFEHLRELQREGKIRRWGVSVESMDEADLCLAQPGLASLQIIFSLFRQKPIDTLFTAAKTRGVALIIRLPLASGLLSGRMTRQTTFVAGDHRTYNRDGQAFNVGETFAGLPFETGVELADALKAHVPAGMSMSRFALRWILDHDAVSVIIPGAKSPAQARENIAASDLPPLPAELHGKLREFYRARVAAHIRGPY